MYVDDILITGNAPSFITQLVHQMQNAFSMKDLGSVSYFLGISIQSKGAGYLLSQRKYASDILAKAGMVNCKPCASPISVKPPSHSSTDSLPFSQPALYRSIVGALQYLTITRPDLAYAVNHACQHMAAPTVAHFTAVKRLLRYVQGTLDHGLFFSPGPFTLQACSDSDWAGDTLDRRSTSGFCIFLGHNLISWSAKKQPTVSRSSTEAEYRALAHTVAELSWLQMLLRDFSIVLPSLPVLWCDNLGALALASNPVFHARSKHIAIDYHFIREKVAAKQLVLRHVSSMDQLADVFTKPLSVSRFHYLRDKLVVRSSPSSLRGNVGDIEKVPPLDLSSSDSVTKPSQQRLLDEGGEHTVDFGVED